MGIAVGNYLILGVAFGLGLGMMGVCWWFVCFPSFPRLLFSFFLSLRSFSNFFVSDADKRFD